MTVAFDCLRNPPERLPGGSPGSPDPAGRRPGRRRPRDGRSRRRASRREHTPRHWPQLARRDRRTRPSVTRRGVRCGRRACPRRRIPSRPRRRPSVSEPVDRPAPLDALAMGVAALVAGTDLDAGLGSLIAAGASPQRVRRARWSASRIPIVRSLELALTVGLDETGPGRGRHAVRDAGHPRRPRGGASGTRSRAIVAVPLIAAERASRSRWARSPSAFASQAEADGRRFDLPAARRRHRGARRRSLPVWRRWPRSAPSGSSASRTPTR